MIDVPSKKPETVQDYLKTYQRLVAGIITFSLGYAPPSRAARILKDYRDGNKNWCEWIASCYGGDPKPAVQGGFRSRRSRGYMADYPTALAIVRRAINTGDEPVFASWF